MLLNVMTQSGHNTTLLQIETPRQADI